MSQDYTAENIQHFENIEHVRRRPGTYIGAGGIHHLVKEVIDNAIDEALAGHCDKVSVVIREDGTIDILDNGRGIPTGIHPEAGIPTPELIVTKLGAGGKFDASSYKVSGGLNGMGVTLVNALSSWFELEIYRDGKIHSLIFESGVKTSDFQVIGKTQKTGTRVCFRPDTEIFPDVSFSYDILRQRLKEAAYLNSGLEFSFSDRRTGRSETFRFDRGLIDFVTDLNANKKPLHEPVFISASLEQVRVDIALQYTDSYSEVIFSFANNILTENGGVHLTGFKTALTRSMNYYAKREKLFKDSGMTPTGDDLREGLTAVISILVPQPQFESQTKVKLMNPEVQGAVEKILGDFLSTYGEENPAVMKLIIQKAESARQAREAARKAREMSRRKTVLSSGGLPEKLADCSSRDVARTEVFIVEGDSAGGSARQARDRIFQAILPIRGKILNVEKAREDKILQHSEIEDIVAALGTGIGPDPEVGFNSDKVRYSKIIIMTDADVDGSHIRTLLLTFFYRQMGGLIESGRVYIAQPPLYMISTGKGRKKKNRYVHSEKELAATILELVSGQAKLTVARKDAEEVFEDERLQELLELLFTIKDLELGMKRRRLSFREYLQYARAEDSSLPIALVFDGETVEPIFGAKALTLKQGSLSSENGEATAVLEEYHQHKEIGAALKGLAAFGFDLLADYYGEGETRFSLSLESSDHDLETLVEVRETARNNGGKNWPMKRFKGLGEMNPGQLWDTTMDPEMRTLLKVKLDDAIEANRIFDVLMGEKVEPRRAYIVKHSSDVRFLDV